MLKEMIKMSTTETIERIELSKVMNTILSDTDNTIDYVHECISVIHDDDDLKSVIDYINHESLIDNIRYGESFEIQSSKYYAIKDERVHFDNIKVEKFEKRVFKMDKETGIQTEVTPIKMVRVLSGYGQEFNLNEYIFFRDVYNGDDKKQCLKVWDAYNKAMSAHTKANDAYINRKDDKKKVELSTKAMDTLEAKEIAKDAKDVLMLTMPEISEKLISLSKATDAMNIKRHSKFQDVCKNRVSIIRTAMKHQKVIEDKKVLDTLNERNTSLKALWEKLTSE